MEVTRRLLTDVVPKFVSQDHPQLGPGSIETGLDNTRLIKSSVLLEHESKTSTTSQMANRSKQTGLRRGWTKRVRLPSWWSGIIYELRSIPQLSTYVFRVYNTVSDDSRILRCIEEGDVVEVQTLFESRQSSPYDVDSEGRSLLHVGLLTHPFTLVKTNTIQYAIMDCQPEIVKLLLELGGTESVFSDGADFGLQVIVPFSKKDNANMQQARHGS